MSRAKKLAVLAGVVVAVLAIGAGAAYLYLAGTTFTATEYAPPVNRDSRDANTKVVDALIAIGIDASYADVTPPRAYVAFESYHPAEPDLDALRHAQWEPLRVVTLATAGATDEIVLVQFVDGKARLAWKISMTHAKAFAESKDEGAAFAHVEETQL